jgi:hypothetical protein
MIENLWSKSSIIDLTYTIFFSGRQTAWAIKPVKLGVGSGDAFLTNKVDSLSGTLNESTLLPQHFGRFAPKVLRAQPTAKQKLSVTVTLAC